MENPFFRTYSPPLYRRNSTPSSRRPQHQQTVTTAMNPSSRKMVTIPVHFVETTEKARSVAAMKIQKVFRGFLVRRSVKKIIGIKREVDEIERRMEEREMVELIKKEVRERLKVNEVLMGLLFRLDSVRGVDSAVRDLRKAVIKKAILLQERVDGIVGQDQVEEIEIEGDIVVGEHKELKEEKTPDDVKEGRDEEIKYSDEIEGDIVVGEHEELKEEKTPDDVKEGRDEEIKDSDEIVECLMKCEDETPMKNQTGSLSESELFKETVIDSAIAKEVECVNVEENIEKNDEIANLVEELPKEEVNEEEEIDEKNVVMEMQQTDKIQRGDEVGKDLMERMMEKNEKLMGLVMELCEKNVVQTQLINSLSQRVENLAKAFTRRKKKRQEKAEVVPNVRRCGTKSE